MADKELASVRPEFVEKASKNLIEDLLDLLLKDGVLNDGQKDSILEENSSRANKARALVDMVKRKGDKASRKMIAHLQSRDPCLYSELGLSSGPPAQSSGPPAQSSGPPAQSSGPPAQSSGPPAQSSGPPAQSSGPPAQSSGPPAQCSGPPAQSSGPPAQPAAEQQMEQIWSNTLIPTSEAFWSEKQNDRNIYPANKNSIRKRVALLITNIKFTVEKYNRNGAEKDEENTEKLLTALGYEVVKHTNLTGKAIDDAVIEFSKHPKLKETDSVLLVIMSHGKLGVVLGVDWKKDDAERPDEFPINNIYKHLGPQKCPALLNKPKIIIIQACRGEGDGSVLIRDAPQPDVVCDNAGEENIEEDRLQYVNKEKDFISLLSCTPDTPSFRHIMNGSFLIRYIADVLNTFAHQDDIEELFRKVMQRFEEFSHSNKRQMASKDRCTLTKRFYFFPGL